MTARRRMKMMTKKKHMEEASHLPTVFDFSGEDW
jgi:hypothetical protein